MKSSLLISLFLFFFPVNLYAGCVSGNCANGEGEYEWESGSKYKGGWKEGLFSGEGVYVWSNGNRYSGNWESGKKNGYGSFYWNDGSKYEGEWGNDHKEGNGKYSWKNGDYYSGSWLNDMRSGQGIMVWSNGDKYSGEWLNNKRHGEGVYIKSNGFKYSGSWNEGKMHGNGVHFWPNGNKYKGEWKNGVMEGRGYLVTFNGDKYSGSWKKNMKHGHGTFIWFNGNVFTGVWQNDKPTNQGSFTTVAKLKRNGAYNFKEVVFEDIAFKAPGEISEDNAEIVGTTVSQIEHEDFQGEKLDVSELEANDVDNNGNNMDVVDITGDESIAPEFPDDAEKASIDRERLRERIASLEMKRDDDKKNKGEGYGDILFRQDEKMQAQNKIDVLKLDIGEKYRVTQKTPVLLEMSREGAVLKKFSYLPQGEVFTVESAKRSRGLVLYQVRLSDDRKGWVNSKTLKRSMLEKVEVQQELR